MQYEGLSCDGGEELRKDWEWENGWKSPLRNGIAIPFETLKEMTISIWFLYNWSAEKWTRISAATTSAGNIFLNHRNGILIPYSSLSLSHTLPLTFSSLLQYTFLSGGEFQRAANRQKRASHKTPEHTCLKHTSLCMQWRGKSGIRQPVPYTYTHIFYISLSPTRHEQCQKRNLLNTMYT